MKLTQTAVSALPKASRSRDTPLEIAQLLDILVRIERRRQERLRSMCAGEAYDSR